MERITLIKINPPAKTDINAELQWIGGVMGLFGERDKDSSCFRVFVTIMRATKEEGTISSDEVATRCQLARGTVVHHITRLREGGLVKQDEQGYRLAADNMQGVLEQIETELDKIMRLTKLVAKDIDRKLDL